MNKNIINNFFGRFAAFAVIFTLLAVPAVEARGRHDRRHGISEGRLNTMLAIGTGLALLDIATRPRETTTTVYTTPAPVTTTTVYTTPAPVTTTTVYTTPGVAYQQTTYTPAPVIPAPRVTYNIYGGNRPAVHHNRYEPHHRDRHDRHDRPGKPGPDHNRGNGKPGVNHRR
jgi:hypothetical protein